MAKGVSLSSVPTTGFLALVILYSAVGLRGQTKPAGSRVTGSGGMILVDTDDNCRLVLDGKDHGVVKPDEAKIINVSLGEHILKCSVEGVPDLIWRKVIEVKNSEQVVALISLKELHIQHNVAPAKVENEKAKTAAPSGGLSAPQTAAAPLEASPASSKERTASHTSSGVVVTSVAKNGFFDQIGLRPGDVILQLNKQEVSSIDQLRTLFSQLSPGSDVVFLVRVQSGTVFLADTLPKTGSSASILASSIILQDSLTATRPVAGASAPDRAIADQDGPVVWFTVLASLAKGTSSQELITEIKGRPIAFAFLFKPNDEINQEYVRSLGGTDGLIRAAREARDGDDLLTDAPKHQLASAEADVRGVLVKNSNKAVLHQLLGMILLMEQPKDAVAELRKAIALDPKSASSHLYLGLALSFTDAEDEASKEARESLRLMPNQVASHLLLYSFLKDKDKDGALAELKRALQVDPGADTVHRDLGDYYLAEKEYDLAIPEYQTAIHLKTSSFPSHSGLAQAFFAKSEYAKAVPEYQEYLRLDKRPGSENAHSALGSCFYQLHQYEQAVAEVRIFLAVHPDDQNARGLLAASLYQLGQFEQAAAEARTVLAAHPDDQNAKGWLAAATSKMRPQ